MTTVLVRRRLADIHPADLTARLHLRDQLVRARIDAGLSQRQYADLLNVDQAAVGKVETDPWANRLVSSFGDMAAPFGLVLRLSPGDVAPDTVTSRTVEALADAATDPDASLRWHVSAVVARLTVARLAAGIPQAVLGTRIGSSGRAVGHVEQETRPPLLSTLQRYTRGLGGQLLMDLDRPGATP